MGIKSIPEIIFSIVNIPCVCYIYEFLIHLSLYNLIVHYDSLANLS